MFTSFERDSSTSLIFAGMAELVGLVQRLEVAVNRLESMSGPGGSAGESAGNDPSHVLIPSRPVGNVQTRVPARYRRNKAGWQENER